MISRMANEPRDAPPVGTPPDILDTPDAGPAAIRGGALRVAGYGVGVLLSVLSAALLFRHLGVENGGRYVTVTSLVLIAGGIVDFGLTGIGVRELAVLGGAERGLLMRNLIGLRIALSLVGVAGAVAFAGLVDYPEVMVLGTLLAGLGYVGTAAQGTLVAVLTVELRLGLITVLELLRQTVFVAAIVGLVLAGAGLLPFLAASIPAALVVLAFTVVLVRGRHPIRPAFERLRWAELLRDMLPFAAATALAAVYFRVSMVLLSLLSSAQQTGYFGASFRVIETLLAVPNLIVTAAFPIFARAARDDRARLGYAVQRLFEASIVAGGFVVLLLVVGAPLIIDVVAGSDFGPSVDVLRIQAAALLVTFAGAPFGYALLSLRRHRELLMITGSALVGNVVLVSILASAEGANGAAAATLFAELLVTVGTALVLTRVDPGLRPALGVTARAAPGFALGCAVLAVPGIPSALAMLIASALYGGLALALRAVPEEMLVEARALLSRRGRELTG
jgi:O-antigen/teichoic acid export membrane protein